MSCAIYLVSLLSPISEGEGGDKYPDSYHFPHSSVPVGFGGPFSNHLVGVNDVVETSSAFDVMLKVVLHRMYVPQMLFLSVKRRMALIV